VKARVKARPKEYLTFGMRCMKKEKVIFAKKYLEHGLK
jgi:hypothetical protein